MGNLVSISDSSTLIGADQPATIRAPEIEAGVGCDFDSYLLVPDKALDDRIAAAKARLGQDVVILGHHYQRDEVIKFADFRGDSLKLSFQAAQAEGRYIVFCGVHFMAESADILRSEHQTVILPDLNAGCSMADMADIGQVEACWSGLSSLPDSRKIIPASILAFALSPIPNAASRSHSLPTKSARPRASSRLFSLRLLAPSGPLARKFILSTALARNSQTTESSRSIPAFAFAQLCFASPLSISFGLLRISARATSSTAFPLTNALATTRELLSTAC